MATGKRYYWIKLRDSFMTSDTVDYLMSQPDGSNYVVLYLMLCLKTINTSGRLASKIGEIIIPYDVEKIQRDCKWFSADTIRVALNLYKGFGLIYEDVDGTLVMADHNDMVGSETDWAKQKRDQIERKTAELLASGNNAESGVENLHTEIRDKRLEIRDRDRDRDKIKRDVGSSSAKRFTPPTVDEVSEYIHEKGYNINPERFVDFYAAKGWMIGPNKMKDWKAAVRTWASKDRDRGNGHARQQTDDTERFSDDKEFCDRVFTSEF